MKKKIILTITEKKENTTIQHREIRNPFKIYIYITLSHYAMKITETICLNNLRYEKVHIKFDTQLLHELSYSNTYRFTNPKMLLPLTPNTSIIELEVYIKKESYEFKLWYWQHIAAQERLGVSSNVTTYFSYVFICAFVLKIADKRSFRCDFTMHFYTFQYNL